MSFTKVLIHFIWSTKNRANFIKDQYKQELLDQISKNDREKQDIYRNELRPRSYSITYFITEGSNNE